MSPIPLSLLNVKAHWGRNSGLKVYTLGWMSEITIGITGLRENLGRDNGIDEPYKGPSI